MRARDRVVIVGRDFLETQILVQRPRRFHVVQRVQQHAGVAARPGGIQCRLRPAGARARIRGTAFARTVASSRRRWGSRRCRADAGRSSPPPRHPPWPAARRRAEVRIRPDSPASSWSKCWKHRSTPRPSAYSRKMSRKASSSAGREGVSSSTAGISCVCTRLRLAMMAFQFSVRPPPCSQLPMKRTVRTRMISRRFAPAMRRRRRRPATPPAPSCARPCRRATARPCR